MKKWFATLLWVPLLAFSPPGADANEQPTGSNEQAETGGEADVPLDPNDPAVTWVDNSHAYATDQAQALTEWMDSFFGDPVYDLEKAQSWLRLDLVSEPSTSTNEDVIDLLSHAASIAVPSQAARFSSLEPGASNSQSS